MEPASTSERGRPVDSFKLPMLLDPENLRPSENSQTMSRGRFAVTQCTGICSMIILLFITFVMLMYKIEGADRLALAVIQQHYNFSL